MEKGMYAFYKRRGISSYDVIRKIKERAPQERIGHGGTLDYLAEGVLVVAIGKEFTKQLQPVLKQTKKYYITHINLGKMSATDDSEGPFVICNACQKPDLSDVKNVLHTLVGEIDQTPPRYSAIKIKGKPAYDRARLGQQFTIQSKKVYIYDIQLIDYSYPQLKIKVVSGSGVYIRSLARDIGKKLLTGAYINTLQRTAVGQFTIENAILLP